MEEKGEYIGRLGTGCASRKVVWVLKSLGLLILLGKQAWRFLTDPGTLAAKIYKAMYYTNFTDATIGNCPSYCWRSIMAVHAMVVSGVRRRIGNGQTTLIWGHPWLRDNPSTLIQIEMPEQLREARVAGLIDLQTHTWDPHILSDLFITEDVERINMIPISPDYEDSWYWMGDPKGTYTVKNAYRRIVGDYENNPVMFDKWISMWKLKVPPKWKTFLWRSICDILPTTTNLIIKRVEVDPICPMCGLDHEDVLHVLVLCEYYTLVWNVTQLPITNIIADFFTSWLKGALAVLTEEQTRFMVAVLYYIWRTRNSAVWKGSMTRPTQVGRAAATALQAYGAAQDYRTQPDAASATSTEPGGGGLRCYVDAGFRHGTGEAMYGILLVAPDGSFVAAKNGKLPVCFSPLMAEAQAYKETLSWLLERNNTSVSLLTDCMELTTIIQHHHTPIRSYVGVTVDQWRTLMSLFDPGPNAENRIRKLTPLPFRSDREATWQPSLSMETGEQQATSPSPMNQSPSVAGEVNSITEIESNSPSPDEEEQAAMLPYAHRR
ncbi:PREDICTED: uncharacterized protein LOC109188557 [Ipomoea nil]|uniref:uncharacterized protein LOC109188557 n=1 Tax=Ipomoea nil TaxID=35883 RepID=UPI000901EE26|nr:PREDICTED: uncharacterized protein LOC109188557 [Ipomoea nil]